MAFVAAWVAAVIALFYGIENWRGWRAWNNYQQQAKTRGEQLDFRALFPKSIPDEKNFAALPQVKVWFERGTFDENENRWADNYHEANSRLKKAKSRENQRRLTDLPAWAQAFASIQAGEPAPDKGFASPKLDPEMRAKAAPVVLAALSTNKNNLKEYRDASAGRGCVYPVKYDVEIPLGILLPHLANIRALSERFQLQAVAELAAGQSAKALEDVDFLFYLADSLKQEPILISQLVRNRCVIIALQPIWEGLAERRWSAPELQKLQTQLEKLNFLVDLSLPLAAEKAANLQTIAYLKRHGNVSNIGAGDIAPGTPVDLIARLMPTGWYRKEQVNYCLLLDHLVEGGWDATARRVYPATLERNRKDFEHKIAESGLSALVHHQLAARMFLPAIEKVLMRYAAAQVAVDEAVIGCALEKCRLAEGNFPENLDALTPKYIDRLPKDVLTGQSFVYRRQADGDFVLYSIGWDLKDDGGKPGKSMFDDKNGDWVWEYSSQD